MINIKDYSDACDSEPRSCIVFFSVPGETYVRGGYEERDPGNTKVAATFLSEMLSCPVMEIVPKERYPRDYGGQVERAKKEWEGALRPELETCPDVSAYDDVYLCYPNWCGTIPMAVATFLESDAWDGKRIHPLCTNEGSGMGSSESAISRSAPEAVLGPGLSVCGTDVRECRPLLKEWISRASSPLSSRRCALISN